MPWTKKVSVSYYRIEAAEDEYFNNFYDTMETLLDSGHTSGSFDSAELKYLWTLHEKVDTGESSSYLFSTVKERTAWPVWFTEDGEPQELTLPEGTLGDISFGIINPAYKFLVCFSAGAGGPMSAFKKMLGQFSAEGIVRLNPVYEDKIDEKVLLWDCFKRISVHMNMPSGDDVTQFATTKAGSLMPMLGYLGGLKGDITISSGGGKEVLSNMMVKDLITELLANDLCTSLTVRGSDFENGKPEQYDIKNAQIKYSEQIEVEGNYITPSEAKSVLLRAINDRSRELFAENL